MTETARLPYHPLEIRERLQARIHDLLPALGIVERAASGVVMPRNPTRDDKRAGSFVIWTGGHAPGAWTDYATGEKGSVYDLIVYLAGLREWIDGYWWALEFLGLERGVIRTAEADQAERQRRERDRAAAEAKAAVAADEKSAALFARWLKLAPIEGTAAETYLRQARGIDLSRLPRQPGALRFAPELEHQDDETGELTVWPAMVAAMTRGKKVVSLHRTWLAPDGMGKAPVAVAKKMMGPSKGAVIRLSRGKSGLGPEKAAEAGKLGPLAIGEGIETGLTVAVAKPNYRVWAGGSLAGMRGFDWPDCASAVVLLRDNDLGDQARAEFDRVEAHWRAQAKGRPVVVAASAVGSDFNDLVRGNG